jgi:hypothetical protein
LDIKIKEVTTNRELRKFIKFPFRLYKGNEYWVPPIIVEEMKVLRKDKNPFFEIGEAKYFLAYKDNKIVGRIAGIISNTYIEKVGKNYGRFGWIDFIDDIRVCKKLLTEVEKWMKSKGMIALQGPLGFTNFDPQGMLIEGFQEIDTLAGIYNYSYYSKYIELCNYKKDIDWIEFIIKKPNTIPEKIIKIADHVKKEYGYKKLEIKSKKEMKYYGRELFKLIEMTYKYNFGVMKYSSKQIDMYIEKFLSFIRKDHIAIIVDKNGKIVAFGITMPFLSKAFQKANGHLFPFGLFYIIKAMKNNDKVELLLIGVNPKLQGKGINAIIFKELMTIFFNNNVLYAETNAEVESNHKIQNQWKLFEKRQHKKRRCYIKKLT